MTHGHRPRWADQLDELPDLPGVRCTSCRGFGCETCERTGRVTAAMQARADERAACRASDDCSMSKPVMPAPLPVDAVRAEDLTSPFETWSQTATGNWVLRYSPRTDFFAAVVRTIGGCGVTCGREQGHAVDSLEAVRKYHADRGRTIPEPPPEMLAELGLAEVERVKVGGWNADGMGRMQANRTNFAAYMRRVGGLFSYSLSTGACWEHKGKADTQEAAQAACDEWLIQQGYDVPDPVVVWSDGMAKVGGLQLYAYRCGDWAVHGRSGFIANAPRMERDGASARAAALAAAVEIIQGAA